MTRWSVVARTSYSKSYSQVTPPRADSGKRQDYPEES
ncbi:hypothetical protein SAMN05444695_1187 [Rhodococcus triatomae]|uniref:Uncharacterized protein n=1 Tax=Rhodococcus triatomae TaxID=300028 RepID=A0A1G8RJX6_9NOCA|nr:hypothetical protein SAMN05444695_1187 [Rhodococcus triatomae]